MYYGMALDSVEKYLREVRLNDHFRDRAICIYPLLAHSIHYILRRRCMHLYCQSLERYKISLSQLKFST